jgi:hypothetical protein
MGEPRYEYVIVYGHRDTYHPTMDKNEPVCWHEGMAKMNALTPGYDDPAWVKPTVLREIDAIAEGRHFCGNCLRRLKT